MNGGEENPARPQASSLVGRDSEIETLDGLIGSLEGGGSALVISGDAGIGKSALLRHAQERADLTGARALRAVGVESEADFAFAGLHQLLGPILGLADRLPVPRRRALEAAFGVTEERVPDRFHVALAAHQLIVEASTSRPQVLLVDDAHWLDGSSVGVLTFIARRLADRPIALIMTERDGYPVSLGSERLPRLPLDRLTAGEAAQLLDREAPGLHPIRRASLLAEAAGNPLALVELAGARHPDDGGPEYLDPTPANLTARLERTFAARLDDLPPDTRAALLAAALDRRASLSEIVGAASTLRGGRVALSAFDAAAAVGLIEIDGGEVRFEHPLVRSAVRQAAPATELIAMYAALAEVVDDEERRVWHRAMAAVGPDEDVATALTGLAAAAHRRGAVNAAAAALVRAVALSGDPRRKGERLLRAAEVAYELGLAEEAGRMVAEAEPLELDALGSARLAWLRQMISGDVWWVDGGARVFVTIAGEMAAEGGAEMALRSLVPIAHRSWWTQTLPRTRAYLVDAAKEISPAPDDPCLLCVISFADPERTGAEVRDLVGRRQASEVRDPRDAMYLGVAAEKAGDMAMATAFFARAVAGLREQGRIWMLAQALVHRGWVATHVGEWDVAVPAATEGAMLCRDTDQPEYGLTGELIAALAAAQMGEDVEERLVRPEAALRGAGGPLLATGHLARGAMAVGEGRLADAMRHLAPVFDPQAPVFHRFKRWTGVLDLAEAGAQGEEAGRMAAIIDDLEEVGRASGAPFLLAQLACARPLLADDDRAEELFRSAIEAAADYPFLRARTLFSYGRWLRREGRGADSREPLRAAVDSFRSLGAARWQRRAGDELRATGERIGPQGPVARDLLTAQELQIAGLAAEGLSNREIGERLFLSHRTIGSHLYRTYPKLGISSRSQLRDALAVIASDA